MAVVKVTLVPSSTTEHGPDQQQFLSSYLLNDSVVIDAGCLGYFHTPQEQAAIKHVLLTHSHIDHVGSLPVFLENAYEGKRECVTVHATQAVLDSLQKDIFNDRLWPDFIALSTPKAPFLKIETLQPGETVEVEGLRITPVPVNHVVPTVGFLVEDPDGTVVIATDTAATHEIWDYANRAANLKAVFLEATFPNSMAWLADVSKHLTPAMFGQELRKLEKQVPVFVVHIKARFRDQVVSEIAALGLPNVQIARLGMPYEF